MDTTLPMYNLDDEVVLKRSGIMWIYDFDNRREFCMVNPPNLIPFDAVYSDANRR